MSKTVIITIVFVISIIIQQFVFIVAPVLAIKNIINKIKRKNSIDYFKNNIVSNLNISKNNNFNTNKYIDIDDEKLKEFNVDNINKLKNHLFKIFVDFETAYNNLDYDIMKGLSEEVLFNNYYNAIILDLEYGNKRIINDIKKENIIIYNRTITTFKQELNAMIKISYIDYTINKKGTIVKGNRNNKKTESFEVNFIKRLKEKEITNCPNCGAVINGFKCEYCKTMVKNTDFKISSIKKIVD